MVGVNTLEVLDAAAETVIGIDDVPLTEYEMEKLAVFVPVAADDETVLVRVVERTELELTVVSGTV